jgi:uncharacterized membrane protein
MWLRSILTFFFFFVGSATSFQSSLIPNQKLLLHQRHVVFSPSSSKLNSFNADTLETLSAAAAVACSSLLGMNVNKMGKLEGIGQIAAIITASHFSSLGISPTSHRFYDICWKWCLPASLSLLLLSPTDTVQMADNKSNCRKTNSKNIVKATSKVRRSRVRDAARREIMALSVPFFIGCIGSILGCLLSYVFCWLGRNNQVRVHKHILRGRKHFLFQPGKLLYEPSEAAVAAGCLISSYIGGSLNYLASAKIIAGAEGRTKAAATGVLSGTFGSVASDMLVMPIYLSTLASITSSNRFRKWFPGRLTSNKPAAKEQSSELGKECADQADVKKRQAIRGSHVLLTAFILPLVGAIVAISDAFERRQQAHGLGLLCICILSSVIANALQPLFARFPRMLSDIGQVTLKLSDASYFILMSVIGTSIDLRCLAVKSGWSSASSVIFSSVPLLVHFIVITTGSLALMKLFPRFESFPLSVEEVVIASNTAICGPATAAALVAKMMSTDRRKTLNKTEWKGLALAGTFWGIVGYAFATYVGVSISRVLLSTIL